jgi:hypothetical protein
MVRKYIGKGLIMIACSFGVMSPSLAAAGAAETAAPATSTASTTTTASPSATTTTTQTTTTGAAAPATAAPATAAPASTPAASTITTSSSTTSTTTNAATSSSTPAASTTSTTATSSTTEKPNKVKRSLGGYPASWVTKKDEVEDKTNYKQTYKNAVHSECVLIAEYLGYKKNPEVRFNQPLEADYRIVKILKGPPLNKRLPIKYEFHDHTNPPTPPGWTFTEKEMPAVGSQWLIFIEHAVPHNGQFETYEGSYGRQQASEDNLNKIYELLQNQGETGY